MFASTSQDGPHRGLTLYREAKLTVRKRGGRKRALGTRRPLALPSRPNERWSLDFVSDAFTDGRRFRVLAVVDDFTRECLCLLPDTSLSGARLSRELDSLIARRGKPKTIVSDNGTEMTSMAILKWCQEAKVEWHYIAPGKPMQNGFVESFTYSTGSGGIRPPSTDKPVVDGKGPLHQFQLCRAQARNKSNVHVCRFYKGYGFSPDAPNSEAARIMSKTQRTKEL